MWNVLVLDLPKEHISCTPVEDINLVRTTCLMFNILSFKYSNIPRFENRLLLSERVIRMYILAQMFSH